MVSRYLYVAKFPTRAIILLRFLFVLKYVPGELWKKAVNSHKSTYSSMAWHDMSWILNNVYRHTGIMLVSYVTSSI